MIAGELARETDLDALEALRDITSRAQELGPMLEAALQVLHRAAGARGTGIVVLPEQPGGARRVVATGAPRELEDHLRLATSVALELELQEGLAAGRVGVRHPRDVSPEMERLWAGFETVAIVPLVFRGAAVGAVGFGFAERRTPEGCRVGLLGALAGQLGAAIENHRLVESLQRRVAELTLLNDAAAATVTLDPVQLLHEVLARLAATFGAETGSAYVREGGRMTPLAWYGVSSETIAGLPAEQSEDDPSNAVARSRRALRWPGDLRMTARIRWFVEQERVRRFVAVPLLARGRAVGSLVLGRRRDEPFSADEVRLLTAVCVSLGVALDNAQLFADTRRRIADLEAVNALALQAFSSAQGDRHALLESACRAITNALGAQGAVTLRLDPATEQLVGTGGAGLPFAPESLAVDPHATPLVAEALRAHQPVWNARVELSGTTPRGPGRSPPAAVLLVPLISRGATRGLLAVLDAPGRAFTVAEATLGYALASELAVALENADLYAETQRRANENARLYEDLRRSYAELARAQEQLIHQERLAALGQLSAVVAHEVRNPLGVIFNSLGSLRRLLQPRGDTKMLLDIVGEEADRLNRIVGDLLDFARPSPVTLRPEAIDRVLDDATSAALAQVPAGRIRLERDIQATLPPVSMDARLVRQALVNVMANAVQAMPSGGTLRVGARTEGESVTIEIGDTGPGIPEEVRHRIFEPFFTTRPTGTGLGLAVVKRILDDHRAHVTLQTGERVGTRFLIRFPAPAASAGTD